MRAANAAKNKSESIVMSARKENVELSEGFKQMLRDFEDVYNNDKTYIQHFERKRLDEIAKGRQEVKHFVQDFEIVSDHGWAEQEVQIQRDNDFLFDLKAIEQTKEEGKFNEKMSKFTAKHAPKKQ